MSPNVHFYLKKKKRKLMKECNTYNFNSRCNCQFNKEIKIIRNRVDQSFTTIYLTFQLIKVN